MNIFVLSSLQQKREKETAMIDGLCWSCHKYHQRNVTSAVHDGWECNKPTATKAFGMQKRANLLQYNNTSFTRTTEKFMLRQPR